MYLFSRLMPSLTQISKILFSTLGNYRLQIDFWFTLKTSPRRQVLLIFYAADKR